MKIPQQRWDDQLCVSDVVVGRILAGHCESVLSVLSRLSASRLGGTAAAFPTQSHLPSLPSLVSFKIAHLSSLRELAVLAVQGCP